MIIDFHSHILPGVDDGARDVETSIRMLDMARKQGVQIQALTPHFYPWRENINSFLERREESIRALSGCWQGDWPQLLVGAEVAYFPHIGSADVRPMCLDGGRLLLVELPFSAWNDDIYDDIAELALDRGFHVMLAHVERYTASTKNREILSRLSGLPVTAQLNAEYFINLKRRDKNGPLQLGFRRFVLGSDAHSLGRRIPNVADGRAAVESRFGMAALDGIDRVGTSLLWENLNG